MEKSPIYLKTFKGNLHCLVPGIEKINLNAQGQYWSNLGHLALADSIDMNNNHIEKKKTKLQEQNILITEISFGSFGLEG